MCRPILAVNSQGMEGSTTVTLPTGGIAGSFEQGLRAVGCQSGKYPSALLVLMTYGPDGVEAAFHASDSDVENCSAHLRLVAIKKPHVHTRTSGLENPELRIGSRPGNKLIFISRKPERPLIRNRSGSGNDLEVDRKSIGTSTMK